MFVSVLQAINIRVTFSFGTKQKNIIECVIKIFFSLMLLHFIFNNVHSSPSSRFNNPLPFDTPNTNNYVAILKIFIQNDVKFNESTQKVCICIYLFNKPYHIHTWASPPTLGKATTNIKLSNTNLYLSLKIKMSTV